MCITGATGIAADKINGMYEITDELSGDLPVYAKVGNEDIWLEYKTTTKSWQVKATKYKGTSTCSAYCKVPAKCLPQECPVAKWQVVMDGNYVYQPAVTISVLTQQEVEAYLAELEREAARLVNGSQHVRITGAAIVNGVYKPTEEMNDNVTVYAKVGDRDRWLVYNASYKDWNVQTTASKGTAACSVYCKVPDKCLPQNCPTGKWYVTPGSQLQPAMTISVVTQEEVKAYPVQWGTGVSNSEQKSRDYRHDDDDDDEDGDNGDY